MKRNEIDLEFFNIPKPKITNKFYLRKYNVDKLDAYSKEPCIFISPNTSVIDKQLITHCINSKFLFINDETVDKINQGIFPNKKLSKLLSDIQELSQRGYCFSLIWNKTPSIFGDNEPVSDNLAYFLYQTKLDVRFLTFPNLYFSHPMWSNKPRNSRIFANQKITITNKTLESYSKQEVVNIFKNSTPSSANIYSNKINPNIKSNERAVGLERIIYCCPTCEKLCALYSEYSCIKCRNCGSVFEINNDGKILFCKKMTNFDEIKNYQFSVLKHYDFNINEIVTYNKITQIIAENGKKSTKFDIILQIYADNIKIINPLTLKEKIIQLDDITNIEYYHNNHIFIILKNAKEFHFFGNNNENLYIIKDLVSINKN